MDFELIVIDDASGDRTPQVIRQIDDKRLNLVINSENLGVVGSRNKGIAMARGTYIAHCDHDDLWAPEKLAKQVAFLDTHPEYGLVSTGISKCLLGNTLKKGENINRSSIYLHWSLLVDSTFSHSAIMYRSSLVRENHLKYNSDYTFADDWDFFLQIAKITKISCLPESLTFYHLHEGNWSFRAADRMSNNGKKVFSKELNYWLEEEVTKQDTDIYFDTLVTGIPCDTREKLLTVGRLLYDLQKCFIDKNSLSKNDITDIQHLAAEYWWRAVAASANITGIGTLKCYRASGTANYVRISFFKLLKASVRCSLKHLSRR